MMFINDINRNINSDLDGIFNINDIKLFILLYADDQVVFAKSPESLQRMLLDIKNYCNTWDLKINASKTKVMIFEKGRHTSDDFYLNNIKLESKKISNDQELIQSDPISCPQNQKGNN